MGTGGSQEVAALRHQVNYQMQEQRHQNELLKLQLASDKDNASKRQKLEHDLQVQAGQFQDKLQTQQKNFEEKLQTVQDQHRHDMRAHEERFEQTQRQHQADMEAYRRDKEEVIQQHTMEIEKLLKDLEEVKEEPFDPKDPDRLVRKRNENFDKFCAMARDYLQEVPKLRKASIAVLGPSGVGKSSIINAFAGRKVTETDVVECTQNISMVHATPEYDMYDVPGNHDHRADFYNVDNLHKLKSLHLILVVYIDRFDHALNVAQLLRTIELPYIMVRNKCNYDRDGVANMKRAYEHDKEKAGDAPLMYLGYAPTVDAVPEGTDKLKDLVKEILRSSPGAES